MKTAPAKIKKNLMGEKARNKTFQVQLNTLKQEFGDAQKPTERGEGKGREAEKNEEEEKDQIRKETEDKTIAKMKNKLQGVMGRRESNENQIRVTEKAGDNQENESEIKKKVTRAENEGEMEGRQGKEGQYTYTRESPWKKNK